MSQLKSLSALSTTSIMLLGLACGLLLGFIDYLTGPEYSFSIFYLLPVSLVTWFAGRNSGILLAILSAVIWLSADLLWNQRYSNPIIPYWNMEVRFGFFLLAVLLLSELKFVNQNLKRQKAELAAEIAEREQAQAALREREVKFRLITENVADLIAFLDVKGTRVYVSPSYQQILGDLIGLANTDSFDEIHPADRERIRAVFCDVVATGVGQRAEYRVLGQGGKVFFLESQWNVIRDSAGQVTNVVTVSRNVTDRKEAEEAISKLSQLVIVAQEGERRRVARELHDGVNQILCSMFCRLEAIDAKIPDHSVKVKEEFAKTRLLLDKAVKEVRRISENLRPSELDTLGLLAAARGLCEEFRERTRIDLQFQQTGFPVRLSPEVELTLFRIVQEALTNIERHAQATKVGVELAREDALVTLNIRDNGKGFPAGPSPDGSMRKGRMGLIGMRERVAFLGGRFLVDSTPDTGTGIAVIIPLRDGDGL